MRATAEQIALARAAFRDGSDEELDRFLAQHAMGTIASYLIAQMTPGARAGFFAVMRQMYPEARASDA